MVRNSQVSPPRVLIAPRRNFQRRGAEWLTRNTWTMIVSHHQLPLIVSRRHLVVGVNLLALNHKGISHDSSPKMHHHHRHSHHHHRLPVLSRARRNSAPARGGRKRRRQNRPKKRRPKLLQQRRRARQGGDGCCKKASHRSLLLHQGALRPRGCSMGQRGKEDVHFCKRISA